MKNYNDSENNKRLAAEILDDFEARRDSRKPYELSWLLNMNFVLGNQYSFINSFGEIKEEHKNFEWESREIFNHIAPIVESRLAKLARVRPTPVVRPTGTQESDIETAKLSKMVLESVSNSIGLSSLISSATVWSEVCGTAFYKVLWDFSSGEKISDYDSYKKFVRLSASQSAYSKIGKNIDGESADFVAESQDNNKNLKTLLSKDGYISAGGTSGSVSVRQKDNDSESAGDNIDFAGEKTCGQDDTPNLQTDSSNGHNDGNELFDGDISVSVCSPFEIFPDSVDCSNVADCASIIHARAIDASLAEKIYGNTFVGQTVDSFSLGASEMNLFHSGASNIFKSVGAKKDNQVLVIERWTKPSPLNKNGRLEIVVGGVLVYEGDMPFACYPFVKQVSSESIACFWGTSVVERCIPIQRSYNAVKNRKIELLARLSGGVLAVEEGSVDVDDLADEGLAPGKILVYRNGSTLPKFMDAGDVPSEFSIEEDRLLNEFITLTGVSELMRNSSLPNSVTSGTAINLLMEQDDTRLSVSAEHIRNAVLEISKKVLQLYKEYALVPKLSKIVDSNGEVQIFYWQGADLTADDIVLDTSNELSETPATRRNMVLELFRAGIFADENGKIDNRMKSKILEMIGFGNWETGHDISALHINRAKQENVETGTKYVLEIDDHNLHIAEHTKFLLENYANLSNDNVDDLLAHIREHKMLGGV